MSRPHAMFTARSAVLLDDIFDAPALARLQRVVELDRSVFTPGAAPMPQSARDVEILITGWGAPTLDAELLEQLPRLRAVVHAAGTVRRLVTPDVWERGIRVFSCADVNALPVAEATLAMILLSAKGTLDSAKAFVATRDLHASQPTRRVGAFAITVGIIGASRIGRRVIELLRPFDIDVLVYDPMIAEADFRALGVRSVALDDLFAESDIVSVHAPSLPETRRMVDRDRLALMRDDGVLINTARGAIVDTEALVDEVASGRLRAVLDVTDPEPLPPDHVLYSLPGVTLTPHVAGALGSELRRFGDAVVDEVERWVAGGVLTREVTANDLARIA